MVGGCAAIIAGNLGAAPTAPQDKVEEKEQEDPAPAPASAPAPIELSGVGQTATDPFELESGLAIAKVTYQGNGYFGVRLLDQNGEMVDLLANAVGSLEGSKATQARAGRHVLDIQADGPWTATIEQPRPSSAPETTSFSGTGQTATDFFELPRGLKTFRITHQGSEYFGVTLLDKDGKQVDLLANEVGAFDGSKATRIPKDDIYLLQVNADGPWTVQVQ